MGIGIGLILCVAGLSVAPTGVGERTFPFPMEGRGLWRIRESFRPAGEDGFISAKGENFVDGKGEVRRFLGVNLYGPAQMPQKKDAEQMAKTLAFWGFNAVRAMPQYTWQRRADGDFSKGPDPELLDRFDYFFAKLKARGIYVSMNLHSARTAGYRFKDFRQTMKENKGIDNFDPTFIQHQKEWDKFVFEHVNPYTGLAYKDDPAVLSWEINNECSLGITWFCWDLWKKMTPPFKAELTRQFGDWLRAKYGSTEKLREAWRASWPAKADVVPAEAWRDAAAFAKVGWYVEGWGRGGPLSARGRAGNGGAASARAPTRQETERAGNGYELDPATGVVAVDGATVRKFAIADVPLEAGEVYTLRLRIRSPKKGRVVVKVGQHGRPYANQGVNTEHATGPEWLEIVEKGAANVADRSNRIQVEFKSAGAYEIAGFSFVRGGESGLGSDESLEAGNVAPVAGGSLARGSDVTAFVLDVEDRYWKDMVSYLKNDLKSKQLVNGGTLNYGAGYPQAHADFLDNHFYYGGLANFPGGKWSSKNWSSTNRAMVRELDDRQTQRNLGLRVFGRPYTISEASQMHQTATAADFFPILFSLAAFQDLAAIHTYTWTHAEDHAYGSAKWLDMHGNAKYLAHLVAARNMFVRGDVKSGLGEERRIVYDLSRAEEREDIRRTGYVLKSNSRPMDPLACVKAATGLRYVDLEGCRGELSTGEAAAKQSLESCAPETGCRREGAPETGCRREGAPKIQATPYGEPEKPERRAVSSTGEITWDATTKGCEFYAVDTRRTKFLSQFGPAGTSHRFADGTTFTLGETVMGWAALSLTETETNQWLLAATGWQQPSGAVVREYATKRVIRPEEELSDTVSTRITTMGAMGDVPFVCEGVRATVRLPVPSPDLLVRVQPLNGDGLPLGDSFELTAEDGFVTLDVDERYRTVWYRIEFRVHGLPAFGAKLPASGADPTKPDCGMTAAKVFDAPIAGLEKVGELKIPTSKEVPDESTASIGFEGLDRKLFEPTPAVYERLGAMGVKWARVQTMWSRCEPQKGVYDFSVLDDVVDRLTAQGIRPWFSVTFGNVNYMKGCYTKAAVGCVPLYYGEECRTAWCRYVRELAKRYRGKVTHWEIWNEPNIPSFWQPKSPNAADYLELVKLTGGVIREEIPDAKIGGCTSSSGLAEWEQTFFKLGGAKAIDFWCCHAYGRVPEAYRHSQAVARVDPKRSFVVAQRAVRKIIDENGGRHVEIWQGEAGYPSWFHKDHWLFLKGVCQHGWQSQANQAKWLLRRFLTDRRAGFARTSFYQAADISRLYSMATITRPHPAEHGVLNGWTYEPKKSYFALGHYNALFATAHVDETVPVKVTPETDAESPVQAVAFRTAEGALRFVYYVPTDYGETYVGKGYQARTDATLTVPAAVAPKEPVLVDLLRGGVYVVRNIEKGDATVSYTSLPLVDYPLALMDRAAVALKNGFER